VTHKTTASRTTSAVATARRGQPRRAQHLVTAQKRKRPRTDATSDATYPSDNGDDEDLSDDEDPSVGDEENSTGSGKTKKRYGCPFATPRDGARTLCKWTPHLDKRSVHLCYQISLIINS
jgi:hypothetical protein